MAARKIGETFRDTVDHNVTSNYFSKLQEIHDNTFIIAEIDAGLLVGDERTGVPEVTLLHTTCSLKEEELSHKFQSKPSQFSINGRIVEGMVCFATKKRSLVDGAMASLRQEHALRNQSGIYVLKLSIDKVKYEIKLNLIPQHQNIKCQHEKDTKKLWSTILHQHTDRSYMEKLMLYFKAETFDICNDQMLISYPKMQKWQLIQYSTKPYEVIFTVVAYMGTVWRDLNKFKDVVSFIQLGNNTYQAIVLFSSLSIDEILDKLNNICDFMETAKIPLPNEIDDRINTPTAVVFKRSNLFQRAEERDSDGQRRNIRNTLEDIMEVVQMETSQILTLFMNTEALDRKLRYHLIKKGISLNKAGFSPESSIKSLAHSTPASSDKDSSCNEVN